MRPSHPETCPNCGKRTWNWYYLSARIWIECEHCGFKDTVSNTTVSGANSDSTTRKMPLSKACRRLARASPDNHEIARAVVALEGTAERRVTGALPGMV